MQTQNRVKDNVNFLKFMEFSGIDEKAIEEKMLREKNGFRINGVMDVEESGVNKQMAYTIFFKKYDNPNTHLADQFRVTLVERTERQGLFLFDDRHPISAKNAFHLLNGRGVMKPGVGDEQIWYQMDFAKRDTNGDGLVQMFGIRKDEFDVEKQLERYFIKEIQQPESKQELLTKLFNGEPAIGTVTINGEDKKFQLEVYPKGPLLNGREIKPDELQSKIKTKTTQKQSWEIPIEKRSRQRKGRSL